MKLSCMEFQDICIIRGQALDIEIPVTENGEPADLSAATAEFGLAPSNTKPYSVTLPASVDSASSTISAPISSAQSEDLASSRYYFSAWVTIAGESTPVARGYITINPDSRTA